MGRFLLVRNMYIRVQISNINILYAGAPLGTRSGAISPEPQGHLGSGCSKRNGAVGTRPPGPSPLPSSLNAALQPGCPGRPGRVCSSREIHACAD